MEQMAVHWLEQDAACLPSADDWFSFREAEHLSRLRFGKRRADWRLGRWTAKRAVSLYLGRAADPRSLAVVEIRPAPSGAPEVFLDGEAAPVSISISHRDGRAACAIAGPAAALGCDLEIVEPRSRAFATDYFTADEQELLARPAAAERLQLLALLWSAKESALKALGVGLRIDTRSVAVELFVGPVWDSSGWRPLRARHEGQVLHGWWRQTGGLVRTLAAAPAPASPVSYRM